MSSPSSPASSSLTWMRASCSAPGENGLIEVQVHDIRAWTSDKHHVTDDPPYGGGGGMVMKPEPVFAAVESVLGAPPACPVILLTPQGRVFTQQVAAELAAQPRLALLCGRYEGIDERIREHLVTDQISIGDYVLTGGELPALVLIDAVARLIPGVLGDPDGATGRLARHRAAGVPALHPPGRVPRLERAGGAALRQPRPDRQLAARASPAAHPASAARTCWRRAELSAAGPAVPEAIGEESRKICQSNVTQAKNEEERNHEIQLRQDIPARFWLLWRQRDLDGLQRLRAAFPGQHASTWSPC